MPLRSLLPQHPLVLDVDGTLILADSEQWNDPRPLPGARELLELLRARGHPFRLLTNGTARPPEEYAERLRTVGLPVTGRDLVTPAIIAAELLAEHYPGEPVYALGGEGVRRPLVARGIPLLDNADAIRARVVFAGWHAALRYDDLAAAARAIWNGAEFWTAVLARALAAQGGRAPAMGGAIAAALAHVTGVQPRLIGKPALEALVITARLLGVPTTDLVMVGDDLEIDVSMARRAGCHAILVRTGTDRDAPANAADWTIAGLTDLLIALPAIEAPAGESEGNQ